MEKKNVQRLVILSIQYLLYKISIEEGIIKPRRNFTYKNNSPLGYKVSINIREKTVERKNVKHNNNDVSNNNNENTFTDKSRCQTPKKQILFIILSYEGQKCENVFKSFKTALHNLYQIT